MPGPQARAHPIDSRKEPSVSYPRSGKSLERIEQTMAEVPAGSLRHDILTCAKQFKTSWIELGRYLVSVHKDKMYKEWGFLTFEAYCAQEVGIRKETSLKLLRSYYFLEKEEPQYVEQQYLDTVEATRVPSCEAVDTLRQVKNNKTFSIEDYENLKKKVLDEAGSEKEVKDVFRQMKQTAREQQEDPETARRSRRLQYLRRMIGSLKSIQREAKTNHFLPGKTLESLHKIITEIEEEIEE